MAERRLPGASSQSGSRLLQQQHHHRIRSRNGNGRRPAGGRQLPPAGAGKPSNPQLPPNSWACCLEFTACSGSPTRAAEGRA